MAKSKSKRDVITKNNYSTLITDISGVLENARKFSARTVNSILTATYWLIGRRIVEYEYQGMDRTEYYGERLIEKLAEDLSQRLGKGFSKSNVFLMKSFYIAYSNIFQTMSGISNIDLIPPKLSTNSSSDENIFPTLSGKFSVNANIRQTLSGKSIPNIMQTPSAQSLILDLTDKLPLPWSHYSRLLSIKEEHARKFYESEALRSGWSVRQLDRQISSQFYERTLLSKNKAAMLKKSEKSLPSDIVTAEEEIKDPFILEFLGLKDEYSENDLEEALIKHLEKFLLELGSDFAFIGRQKRLRIGGEWYRIDLLFFHRQLRCLVVIDLKVGKFTHADAGQMHLYLNYTKEHWTNKNENPPVGLILCAEKDSAVAKYALEGLPNKILAAEYKLALPNEKLLQSELNRTQKMLSKRFKKND